jgi:hypothetical protein
LPWNWRCSQDRIDLGRQDEVIFSQPPDRVGPNVNLDLSPSQADIGVVIFPLGDFAHLIDKLESLSEIRELENLGQMVFLNHAPTADLLS